MVIEGGLRLSRLPLNNPLHTVGLRQGDVITHLNEIPFSSPNNAPAAIDDIKRAGMITVDFMRLDRPLRRSCVVHLEE